MALELFHFTGSDGKDYTLPKVISSGMLRKIRKLNNLDAAYTLLEELADETALAATDEMPAQDVMALVSEWMQGASSGESSRSSS